MSKRSSRRKRAKDRQGPPTRVNMAGGAGDPGTAMPPSKGAPRAVYPIAVTPTPGAIAPQPVNDRFPTVIGQGLSLSYIASVFRLCTTGYRQQYVDLLNELLEQDAHLFSVITKRILSSAIGRVAITPCDLPEGHPERGDAEDLADFVTTELARIPDQTRAWAELLWAIYYGLSAQEIYWTRDSDGWHVERLGFIHSRRLAYPDYQSWSLYIWDQGQVYGWASAWGSSPTNRNVFGARVEDYPGKFIVHTPQIRGDYPTRDGVGRQTATWAAFKRIGGRGASEYLERFAKPMMDVVFTTGEEGKGPRLATDEDIAIASQIAASIGPGSGSYASHPDSVKVNPLAFDQGSSSKLTWSEWIGLCNGEESKAALGGTLGTEVGKGGGGNRSLGEVQERAEADLEKYDATCFAETIRRDLVSWIVRLNRPDKMHLLPKVQLHLDTDPDPKAILALAKLLTDMGAPVDLDATANTVGIALVDNDDEDEAKPRQSFRSDLATTIKTLTQCDYPVDLDAVAKMTGIPIVALEDMTTARRSRIVTGGPESPVEPDRSDDPNDPNYAPPPAVDTAAQPGADTAPPDQDATGAPTSGAPSGNRVTVRTHQRAKAAPKPKTPEEKTTDAVNATLRGLLLMTDRPDKAIANQVFDQLLEDYPKQTLGWVLAAHWAGPVDVPLSEIDFSSRAKWRASHEPIDAYVDRIKAGRIKPVILVKTPGNSKMMIVDGHHRTLADEKLGLPARAYVATVHSDNGDWDELHASQKKGSSKGSASWLESMQRIANLSYADTSAPPAQMTGAAADPADTFRPAQRIARRY